MVHRSTLQPHLLAAVALTLAACGSNVSNASPSVGEVPLQSTTGSSAFSIDLAGYVSDREGATLTYAVTEGGGSFAGSVYSNTFATMGEYTVGFTVSDGAKTTAGSFVVRVTEGNFVVVREDNDGLLLLDSRTNEFVRVAAAAAAPTFVTGLGDGRLVYQISGAAQQLWLFDPLARQSTRLAATATDDVTYRAKTAAGQIVFTTGSGNGQRLYLYSPTTTITREIAQGLLSSLSVVVDSDDIVYYEVGVNGQADVYAYDPSEDEAYAVGTETTDEQIQAVVPSGGVVFTRLGAGGEADLFCYRTVAGLVEVGVDVSGLGSRNKVFHACGSADQVVFSAQNGADNDLFAWSPASGQTTTVASGGVYAYDLLGTGNELVYHHVVGAGEEDVYFRDLDTGVTATVRDDNDISQVLGSTNDGTRDWVFLLPSGTPTSILAVSLVASPVTVSWASGTDASPTIHVLSNGDVVTKNLAGTRLGKFNADIANWGTDVTGTGLAFAGDGIAAGDYVITRTVGAQADLEMFDDSGDAVVVISDEAGDDTFQGRTEDGTVMFTRAASGNTNFDLFVWDGAAVTRLTGAGSTELCDHAVLGSYRGVR